MSNLAKIALAIGISILALLAAFLLGRFTGNRNEPEIRVETKTDTLFKHSVDTVFIPITKIEYVEVKTVDTLVVTDTILLREQKHYKDEFADIYISGVQPELDSLRYYIPRDTVVCNTTTTITKLKSSGFGHGVGISLQAGYGFSYVDKQIRPAPYIGVGISYSIGYYKLRK